MKFHTEKDTHTHIPRPDAFLSCFEALIRNGESSSKCCPRQLITLLQVPNSLSRPDAHDVWAAIKQKSHICERDAAQVAQPRSGSVFARRNGFCKLAPVYAQSIILCWNAEYQNLGLGKWSCRPTLLPAYLLSHSRRMDLAPLRCCYLLPYLLRPQEVTSEYSEPRAHPCQGIARQEACLEEFSGSRSRHHTLPIGKKIWREMRTLAQLNSSNSRSSSDSSNTTESVAIVRKLTQKTFLLVAFRRP